MNIVRNWMGNEYRGRVLRPCRRERHDGPQRFLAVDAELPGRAGRSRSCSSPTPATQSHATATIPRSSSGSAATKACPIRCSTRGSTTRCASWTGRVGTPAARTASTCRAQARTITVRRSATSPISPPASRSRQERPRCRPRSSIASYVPAADRWPLVRRACLSRLAFQPGTATPRPSWRRSSTMFGQATSFDDFERKSQMMNLESTRRSTKAFLVTCGRRIAAACYG